jgi:cell division protein FtsX
VAASVVFGLHEVLNSLSNNSTSVLAQMRLTGWEIFGTDAIVIVIGALIGTVGSAVAIRRFLDV